MFLVISAAVPDFPWRDRSIKDFVRVFLYETLLTNDPDATLEVTLQRKGELRDVSEFVGVQPSYWVQLRVSSRGLRISQRSVEEFFADHGYLCQEWVGVEDSTTRLGIFRAIDKSDCKLVFCTETERSIQKCDLLLPIFDAPPLPQFAVEELKQ